MKWFRRLLNHIRFPRKAKIGSTIKKQKPWSADLQENLAIIKDVLGESEDVIIRRFKIGTNIKDAFLLHIDGLSDQNFIAENIMKPLTILNPFPNELDSASGLAFDLLENTLVTAGDIRLCHDQQELFADVLSGDTALFLEGCDKALIISTRGFISRGVQEPSNETVVRGPREGFSEPFRINTSLIRRKITSPNLRLKNYTIGRETKTKICLVYLKGVCDEQIVGEVEKRLSRIDTDSIMGAGMVEQFINDSPLSPFATIGYTERPDVAAARIMEGRIAIIVEGTPIVLTVPHLFVEAFQSVDDYMAKPTYMTVIRWVRFLAFLTTVFVPATYIALTTFHQEMIPTQLLITMAAAREGIPFPALVEALAMGVTFEFLREAGIRMPRPVGQAVSIVGALVIGEAAVSAGLIGAPMVIITALTAITSFITPLLIDVTTILRFSLTIFAGIAGFYGVMLGTMLVLIHMVTLRSFGIPYMSPLAPITFRDFKDVFVKAPIWAMDTRPRVIGYKNKRRQKSNNMPAPPKQGTN